jgi:RecA/RadA recombinase
VAAWIPSLALAAHLVPARQLENREKRPRISSGLAPLDEQLAGGWPRGALSELVGGRSSGRTGVLMASLAEALRQGATVGLIDVEGMLDLRAAERAGISLRRLLWVRCQLETALPAAEIVLAAGGFGLVAVDLAESPARAPTAAWPRL